MKIIHKRIYITALFVAIILFLSNYIQYIFQHSIIVDNTREITKLSSIKFERYMDSWLKENRQVIDNVSENLEYLGLDDQETLLYLRSVVMNNDSFSAIYYGSYDNKMIHTNEWVPYEDFDLTERPWYQSAIKQKNLVFTEPYVDASNNEVVITIASPVRDIDGKIRGVVGGDLQLRTIIRLINKEHTGDSGFSFLADSEGNLLAHPYMKFNDSEKYIENAIAYKNTLTGIINDKEGFAEITIDNTRGFLSYITIPSTGWILATFIPEYEYSQTAAQLTFSFILSSIVSIILFLAFVWYNSKYVLNPIVRLKDSLNYIRKENDLSHRVINIESHAFNDLVDTTNDLLERLEFQNQKFFSLFKHSIDAITVLDSQHRIIDINENFTKLFGYKLSEIEGQDIDELLSNSENFEEVKGYTNEVQDGNPVDKEGIRYSKEGKPIYINVKGVPVIVKGKVIGLYAIYSDITEKKNHEEKLNYLSMHDTLTGLYNRTYFEKALSEYDKEDRLPLSLLIGDFNGLKLTNDAFGHKEGDNLLIKISDVFRNVCRDKDIICRLGGDEFVLMLPNTSEAESNEIAKEIFEICAKENETIVPLSISIGVCTKTDISQDINEVFKEAEDRMYRNKLLNSKSSRNAIITSLFRTLKEKTYETEEHCKRLEKLSIEIGEALGLSNNELDELRLLGTLHDIGKVAIPNEILLKKEPLTVDEWEVIKKHPEIGYRIALATPEMAFIAEKILCHHERWDGKGYPKGLKGEEIPLTSRILSIVDTYDVMIHGRPYKEASTREEAIEEIKRCSGTQFDPKIVDIFVNNFSDEIGGNLIRPYEFDIG